MAFRREPATIVYYDARRDATVLQNTLSQMTFGEGQNSISALRSFLMSPKSAAASNDRLTATRLQHPTDRRMLATAVWRNDIYNSAMVTRRKTFETVANYVCQCQGLPTCSGKLSLSEEGRGIYRRVNVGVVDACIVNRSMYNARLIATSYVVNCTVSRLTQADRPTLYTFNLHA